MTLPTVTIVVTLYEPLEDMQQHTRQIACLEAIHSWRTNLKYDGLLAIHLADDGSRDPSYVGGIQAHAYAWCGPRFSKSRQERKGVGASLNTGFNRGLENSPIVAYFVDDWLLTAPLDITPWVKLLERDTHYGCIRLGPPHPDLEGHVEMVDEGWVLCLDRHHYALAMRPALYHQRFFAWYGAWKEGVSAHECERLKNEAYCSWDEGPKVALALPHPWEPQYPYHVGKIEP